MTNPVETATILVVDDEEAMRAFLRSTLRRRGFEVPVATDGEEAREIIEQGGIDLIITDLTMPRMGGMELLHWVRARRGAPPVIVMTGYASIPSLRWP